MRPALLFLPIKSSSVAWKREIFSRKRPQWLPKDDLGSWLSLLKSLAQPMRQACDDCLPPLTCWPSFWLGLGLLLGRQTREEPETFFLDSLAHETITGRIKQVSLQETCCFGKKLAQPSVNWAHEISV